MWNKTKVLFVGLLLLLLPLSVSLAESPSTTVSSQPEQTVKMPITRYNNLKMKIAELERTRAELERGQSGIRQAEETTDGLRGRNEQSSAVISDSQRIIGEIGEEFRDIDEANGLSETQASGQEQAE